MFAFQWLLFIRQTTHSLHCRLNLKSLNLVLRRNLKGQSMPEEKFNNQFAF